MLHWHGNISQGSGDGDWVRHNKVLSQQTVVEVAELSKRVISSFGLGLPAEYFTTYPGFVLTEKQYDQELHLDEEPKEGNNPICVVHVPLCSEGMNLRVLGYESATANNSSYGVQTKEHKVERMLHIPFGMGLVLPIGTYHAGCYGSEGNLRFHMQIRPKTCAWVQDSLTRVTGETHCNTYYPKPNAENQLFAEYYMQLMWDSYGSLLREEMFQCKWKLLEEMNGNRSTHPKQKQRKTKKRGLHDISPLMTLPGSPGIKNTGGSTGTEGVEKKEESAIV